MRNQASFETALAGGRAVKSTREFICPFIDFRMTCAQRGGRLATADVTRLAARRRRLICVAARVGVRFGLTLPPPPPLYSKLLEYSPPVCSTHTHTARCHGDARARARANCLWPRSLARFGSRLGRVASRRVRQRKLRREQLILIKGAPGPKVMNAATCVADMLIVSVCAPLCS